MTALKLEKKGYQPFSDPDYYDIEQKRRRLKLKLTEVEKKSMIRDVIIKNSGMELFE